MKIRIAGFLMAAGAALVLSAGASIAATAQSEDFVTHGGKWGSPVFGTGATVTYSFMGSGLETDAGPAASSGLDLFMPFGFLAEITRAFDAWSAVANITFNLVADPGVGWADVGADAVDIRIGGETFNGPGGVLAHAFFPPPNGANPGPPGDIHFDTAENWTIGDVVGGFDIFTVAAHEIGHAIGLRHTNVPDSLLNPFYAFSAVGPRADDIAGAQFIYGDPVVAIPPIPVPASLPLLLGAFALMGFVAKRKSRKAA